MFKKLLLVFPFLILLFIQCWFIYHIDIGGGAKIIGLWNYFDIIQTDYSKFIFSTIRFWWALPVLCVLGFTISLYYSAKKYTLLILVLTLIGTIALCWSVYAPELLLNDKSF